MADTAAALTDRDRDIIARARELAAIADFDAVEALTECAEPGRAFGIAFGQAQSVLSELAAIAERLGGGNA